MDRKPAMVIGQKGVKYGLQLRGPGSAAGAGAKPVAPKPTNVFGADSDSEEDVGTQVARQADKKRAAAKVLQVYEDALAQDASVFDYDGVYDSLQEQRVQPKQQEKIERKSRYIAQLKDQAERRKREDDIAFERRQLKDRAKEDHLFEDKEVFVTAAYKKKLEEQKLWQEEERRKEEEEAKHDVRSIGHLGNFYANLLTSNVAFGTGADGSKAAGAMAGPDDAQDKADPGPSSARKEFTTEELEKAAAKAGVTLDKYEIMRMEAEKARRWRAEKDDAAGGDEEKGHQPPREAGGDEGVHLGTSTDDGGGDGASNGRDVPAGDSDKPAVAPAAGKRRNDDSAVLSARERYLARKKQAT